MADFFLSDTDESAVDELISQVKDLSILEQVSKINCSSFSNSLLPTDLETRFHKLKSFPQTHHNKTSSKFSNSKSTPVDKKSFEDTLDDQNSQKPERNSSSCDEEILNSKTCSDEKKSFKDTPDEEKDEKHKFNSGFSPEMEVFKEKKSRHGSFDSGLNSSTDSSLSPPKGIGCLWCSPKRVSKKKSSRENNWKGNGFDWEYGDDEVLSDLGVFTEKQQKRIMKKAMKEQERVNREAEKIVKWAKQASARMEFSGVEDDDLMNSDDDDRHL